MEDEESSDAENPESENEPLRIINSRRFSSNNSLLNENRRYRLDKMKQNY